MEIDIEKLPLLQGGPVIACYADCMGLVEILEPGSNVRITFVELRTVKGVRYRVPVLELTSPLWSCRQDLLQVMLDRARESRTSALH